MGIRYFLIVVMQQPALLHTIDLHNYCKIEYNLGINSTSGLGRINMIDDIS
jgi:hypothetical protein